MSYVEEHLAWTIQLRPKNARDGTPAHGVQRLSSPLVALEFSPLFQQFGVSASHPQSPILDVLFADSAVNNPIACDMGANG